MGTVGQFSTGIFTLLMILANIDRFIEDVYNSKRLHSSIGYKSPINFEKAFGQHLMTFQKNSMRTPKCPPCGGKMHSMKKACSTIEILKKSYDVLLLESHYFVIYL